MNTIFDVSKSLGILRANNDYESFGVFYQSKSDNNNKHYVIVKNETDFINLKAFHSNYDFKFNKLGV